MLFVVSEVYYPEEAATAHYMASIAEALAARGPVRAICATPKYDMAGRHPRGKESRHGVEIHRCWGTAFDKNRLLGRILNAGTASVSMFARTLWVVRRGDLVFLVTNPPLLPLFALLACRVRGARCCLRIDDVYPEAMVHAGLIRPGGILASIANWANRRLYRRMDRIIVLGRDMKRLVEEKLGYAGDKVLVIPNWADTDSVAPAERCQNRFLAQYGLQGKFVVGYAGNIGRVQAVESLFEAASLLEGRPELHFLVFGSGQKVSWLARAVAAAQLTNLTLAGLRSRAEQAEMLNAFDVGAIALVRGMAGAGVPSRLYNLMAAGRPVLAALDAESEVAQVVREEKIGWVVPPDEPQKLAGAILEASSNRERLKAMGARARKAAEEKYSAARILGLYERVLGGKT